MKNKKIPAPLKDNKSKPQSNLAGSDVKVIIENHQKAAMHHTAAAKHHLQAVKYYEEGQRDKAAHSALLAHGHHLIAGEFLNDNAKYHAHLLKQTNYQ